MPSPASSTGRPSSGIPTASSTATHGGSTRNSLALSERDANVLDSIFRSSDDVSDYGIDDNWGDDENRSGNDSDDGYATAHSGNYDSHGSLAATEAADTASVESTGAMDQGPTHVAHPDGHTTININGFGYTRYHLSSRMISFRCSKYRSAPCKAKAHYMINERQFALQGVHICQQRIEVTTPVVDLSERMREATDELALMRIGHSPEAIWKQIHRDFYETGTGIAQRGLTREQVIRRVHRVRSSYFGADIHGVVEVPPLSLVSGTALPFFKFQNSYMDGNKLERIIGWAHPDLHERLMTRQSTLFIDGTFRCVPSGFYQCITFMVHDFSSDMFLSAFFVLSTSKTQEMYWNVINAVVIACNDKLQPETVVCDFELALIDAVHVQFPASDVVGCYFHFKQACRRKLKKLGVPEAEVNTAMERGVLDALTVIPRKKIAGSGICYVQKAIQQRCEESELPYSESKWSEFWIYFKRTWLGRYKPKDWNVHGLPRSLVTRTNNPLERFNREINAAIGSPHPSLTRFVGIIDELGQRYARQLEDQRKLRSRKRRRRNPEPWLLPEGIDLESDEEGCGSFYQSDSEEY